METIAQKCYNSQHKQAINNKNKYLFDWRKSLYKDDSLTLHTDLYQINMMQVYFNQGIHNKKAVFEVYFRQLPFKNGFAVFAGLERIVNYLENLTFQKLILLI